MHGAHGGGGGGTWWDPAMCMSITVIIITIIIFIIIIILETGSYCMLAWNSLFIYTRLSSNLETGLPLPPKC